MTDPTASKKDFAALCNVDKSRVSHWIKNGTLSDGAIVGEGRSARIHIQRGMAQITARRDPAQVLGKGRDTRPPGPGRTEAGSDPSDEERSGEPDFNKEKARLTRAQAESQELKNAVARKDLIPSVEVETRYSNFTVTVRSRMLSVPARVKEVLPKLTASDVAAIDGVVRAVLTETSRADLTE